MFQKYLKHEESVLESSREYSDRFNYSMKDLDSKMKDNKGKVSKKMDEIRSKMGDKFKNSFFAGRMSTSKNTAADLAKKDYL